MLPQLLILLVLVGGVLILLGLVGGGVPAYGELDLQVPRQRPSALLLLYSALLCFTLLDSACSTLRYLGRVTAALLQDTYSLY